MEIIGAAASALQLADFCFRFHRFYANVSDAAELLFTQRKQLEEFAKSLQQLEHGLPLPLKQDECNLSETRADIQNLRAELDKLTPGTTDGRIKSASKILKYTFKRENIESAFNRLEHSKSTLMVRVLTIMNTSKRGDLLEIRDGNQRAETILNELSAQMNNMHEDRPRISQIVTEVGIDMPIVARKINEIYDELPNLRRMMTTVQLMKIPSVGNHQILNANSEQQLPLSLPSFKQKRGEEEANCLQRVSESNPPGESSEDHLSNVGSDLERESDQEEQVELQGIRQLNPRSRSFDFALTGVSRGLRLPDNTSKDQSNEDGRSSPKLTVTIIHQGMEDLYSNISGTERPLRARDAKGSSSIPITNPRDGAAKTFAASTISQTPLWPSRLSHSGRDTIEDLFVRPSQPITIVIKDPSDGSIRTPPRSKTSMKPPSLIHSPWARSKIQRPVFVRPGPIQPITIKEPGSGNVIDLPRPAASANSPSWSRPFSGSHGPHQNLFVLPSSGPPITLIDPSGRDTMSFAKR